MASAADGCTTLQSKCCLAIYSQVLCQILKRGIPSTLMERKQFAYMIELSCYLYKGPGECEMIHG